MSHVTFLVKERFSFTKIEVWKLLNEALALTETVEYSKHIGFLHLFAELCANYFEANLDERSINAEVLEQGLEKAEVVIEEDLKSVKSGYSKEPYHKFYLTRGRLLVLTKKYIEGQQSINEAIELLRNDKNRESKVSLYEIYINKISLIKAFDDSNARIENIDQEMDKQKIESLKLISIFSAVIGFVIGGIKAFESVSDFKSVALIIGEYAGFVVMLIGIIYLFFYFTLSGSKKLSKSVKKGSSLKYRFTAPLLIAIICIVVGLGIVLAIYFHGIGML